MSSTENNLFSSTKEWKSEVRGQGTISNFFTFESSTEKGITIEFNFTAVSPESTSVWAGISTSELTIPPGTQSIGFRLASDTGCLLKFTIRDSLGIGYDLRIPVASGGEWANHIIPLDPSAFGNRWGKAAAEMPNKITFPIVNIGFSVLRSPDYPTLGSLKAADLTQTPDTK